MFTNGHPSEFDMPEFKVKNVHVNMNFAQTWEKPGFLDMGQNALGH